MSRALFPLGEMSKPEAREAARQHGLAGVSEKKESQEICFVPDGNYAGFIDRYLEYENATERLPGEGEIVDTNGRVIGHAKAFIATRSGSVAGWESQTSVRCM